jgi:hypothetical protein
MQPVMDEYFPNYIDAIASAPVNPQDRPFPRNYSCGSIVMEADLHGDEEADAESEEDSLDAAMETADTEYREDGSFFFDIDTPIPKASPEVMMVAEVAQATLHIRSISSEVDLDVDLNVSPAACQESSEVTAAESEHVQHTDRDNFMQVVAPWVMEFSKMLCSLAVDGDSQTQPMGPTFLVPDESTVVHPFAVEASSTLIRFIGVATEANADFKALKKMDFWFAVRSALAPGMTEHGIQEIGGRRGTPMQIIIEEVLERMKKYYFNFKKNDKSKKAEKDSRGKKAPTDPSQCLFTDVDAILKLWLLDSFDFDADNVGQDSTGAGDPDETEVSIAILVERANKLMSNAKEKWKAIAGEYNLDSAVLHLQHRKNGNDLAERAWHQMQNLLPQPQRFPSVFSPGLHKHDVLVHAVIAVIMFVRNDECTARLLHNAAADFEKTVVAILQKPEFHGHTAGEATDLVEEYKMMCLVEAVLPKASSMAIVTDFVSRLVNGPDLGSTRGGSPGPRKPWLNALHEHIAGKHSVYLSGYLSVGFYYGICCSILGPKRGTAARKGPTKDLPLSTIEVGPNETVVSPAEVNAHFSPAECSSSRAVSPLPQEVKKRSRQDHNSPISRENASRNPEPDTYFTSSEMRYKHHVTGGTPPRFQHGHTVAQVGPQQPAAIPVDEYSSAFHNRDSPVMH